jgi:raffinose/stachyose/melibiose transport system substrate-binding protein
VGRIGALRATGLAVALILFGACEQDTGGRATESLGGKVEAGPIEVGTLKGEGTSAWQWERDLADELERDFPGAEVELTFAGSEARTALEQRWRAGNGPDADYFIFQGTDPKAREWANEGFLMNLEGVLNKPADSGRAWIDSFLPAAYDFMRNPEDGGLYGVPTEMTAIVVFYNAKMFDKLSLEAPRTWGEFLAVGETLKDEGIDPVAVAGGFAPYMAMWNDYLTQRLVGEQKESTS